VPEDLQSVELQQLLSSVTAEEFVAQVTGLEVAHPLYSDVVAVVRAHQA